jgi:type I restriction-modification system DNA methylase subunit
MQGGTTLSPESIMGPLLACGYRPDLLRRDFSFGNGETVPLVGFSQSPVDSRSACVAVLSTAASPRSTVENCRPLGAPLVFVCFQDMLQWWKQGAASAEHLESIPAGNVDQFFRSHHGEFSPEAVYRAKTWGRFQTAYQLKFVDLGLMPLVEEQVGESLGRLIERNVSELKESLGWKNVDSEQGHWLLQTIFWLVSAKILRDKRVKTFEDLDLSDVEEVFQRLGNHYGTKPLIAGSKKKLEALRKSARIVSQFSSLVLTTTEALAYVYENTLISKETRSALGTHSTPSFLVDYVVGNLADWVQEIPVNERSVYEPACGHAAFLVSAMRLLTELLPAEKAIPSKRGPYLRSRLHGTDVDSFALELARLSLTLTDIPNPDGWDLQLQDMFLDNRLGQQASGKTILLANPPFDKFTPKQQRFYLDRKSPVRFMNKSVEMLWRTLPQVPDGGVFGVVLPQGFLHTDNARDLREFLIREYELREICLFPDKVFSFSDAESAVLIGRRRKINGPHQVRYRRIRERGLQSFRSAYIASTTQSVYQSRFAQDKLCSLRLPDLEEVWRACAESPTLADVAAVGQGLIYHGKHLPPGSVTYSEQQFSGSQPGFVLFDRGLQLHQLPKYHWMNLDSSVIRRPMSGTTVGTPQVLLNYAPASRGPWRLKALVDRKGHPATSNFITVRPRGPSCSIDTLWALLNSPIANAYAFSHLARRHNIVGDIREIPLPKITSFGGIERAATAYFEAASSAGAPANLHRLLLQVDCEVLKLYSLPLELEQAVLALFTGWERVGVPFVQCRYLPRELVGRTSFADFLQFEQSWPATNRERGKLIDKNIAGTLSVEEETRLNSLQAYADYHLDQTAPRPTNVLDELEDSLFSGVPKKDRAV